MDKRGDIGGGERGGDGPETDGFPEDIARCTHHGEQEEEPGKDAYEMHEKFRAGSIRVRLVDGE